MSDELFTTIKNKVKEEVKLKNKDDEMLWLIFTINQRPFALPSNSVKEIFRNPTVFPLPFSPSYLTGVLNRYGDPYAVIDPALLIGEEAQNSVLFITLNDDTHTCFKITDVREFFTATQKDINKFSEEEISDFFEGTLSVNGNDILIIKTSAFLERLGNDIERA